MKSVNDYIEQPVNEAKAYDELIEGLQKAKAEGKPLDEGLFTGLFAGAAAFAVGPAIMKAVCETLGIDIKGPLGGLMTSRLILTAMAAKLGYRA